MLTKISLLTVLISFLNFPFSVFAEKNIFFEKITEEGPKKKFKKRVNKTNQRYISNLSKSGGTHSAITGKNGRPNTKPPQVYLSHRKAKRNAKKNGRNTRRNGKKIRRR